MGNPHPKGSPETQFKPGNTASLQHGGAAAELCIQRNEPLHGPARQAELAVYAELETAGRFSLVKRNAARLQATCDLYWSAISRLMQTVNEQSGDVPADVVIVKLDKYVKRFGWLAGASLRAWAQVKDEAKDSGALVADYEEMLKND